MQIGLSYFYVWYHQLSVNTLMLEIDESLGTLPNPSPHSHHVPLMGRGVGSCQEGCRLGC